MPAAMRPKLEALNGPLRTAEFPLVGTLTIGRDSANSVCLEDASVSPHHCVIRYDKGSFLLTDLDSDSGTFVNGIPVNERVLSPSDQIAVGSSLFLFRSEKTVGAARSTVQLDENSAASGRVQQLKEEELLYLHPDSLAALPPPARLARALSTLLKISAAIGSIRDVESLQWQLLGMIFDVIPAERGAILLVQDAADEISSPVAWDRLAGPDHPVHVNRELVRRVIGEGVSILENGGPGEHGNNPANSIMCVPLKVSGQVHGVAYLHSSTPGTFFSEDDLQLLGAIAGLAAIAIENARQFENLGIENRQLRAEAGLQHDMVGQSPRMREVYRFIERVAPSESTVLICGESGTGKELAARAVHNNSPRKDRLFLALNCAALSETLLESELFGHEKGAFTSAINQKKGLLEVAEGGSVFLDEVGELPLTLQAKLLRVLQEREIVRVGGTRSIKINVRFLAATNRDLQKAVRENEFRADLYHRLNVISLTMPPLREHAEDIPLLAELFAFRNAQKCNFKSKGISPDARACLMRYAWPGNIRELENAMERAVVIGSGDLILPEDLPEAVLESGPSATTGTANYHDAVRDLKKQLILRAWEQSGGSFTEAARILGVHANYLHRLIRNLDLRVAMKKNARA
jgi:transcriptional regulator with GAF, ATPase, and Fis domain